MPSRILTLSWYERIALWSRLGVSNTGNLREAHMYLRLIDRTRPTDEEKQACGFEALPGGFSWNLPVEEFGALKLELEDDERTTLIACLEATNPNAPVPVKDARWMIELVEQLKAKAEA